MAIGSRRTTPTAPVAAAVVSEASVAPMNVPCCQLKDWNTSGMSARRRAPNRIALIGTPSGACHFDEIVGQRVAGTVNRLFGWAAASPLWGVQGRPRQSFAEAGGGSSWPSHQTVLSGRSATFV